MSKTVVITGASGFLGSHLVEHFKKKGWNVQALVREPAKYSDSKQVQYLQYELGKKPDAKALSGATHLIHAAYIKHSDQKDAFRINLEGSSQLLAASRKAGIKKNIFISSMSAHSEAISFYGKQKFAIEKIFDTSNDLSIRPGLILGNGGIVMQMIKTMRRFHFVPVVGGGKQPVQIISIDDLCLGIEKACISNISGAITLANPTVYTYREFYTTLARILNIRVFFVSIPFGLLSLIFNLVAWLRVPMGISKDSLLGLKMLRSVDTTSDLGKLKVVTDDLEATLSKQSTNL